MNMDNVTVGSRVEHVDRGEGIVSEVGLTSVKVIFVHGGEMSYSKSNEDLEIIEANEAGSGGGGPMWIWARLRR